ncbi:MAG: hypothetical protein ACYSTI_10530 [Planctomycetota bacterium]|jgi:hypothetical protein
MMSNKKTLKRRRVSQKIFPGADFPPPVEIPTLALHQLGEAQLNVIKPKSWNKLYRLVWVADNGPYFYAAEDTTEYRTREAANTALGYLKQVVALTNTLAKILKQLQQEERDGEDTNEE